MYRKDVKKCSGKKIDFCVIDENAIHFEFDDSVLSLELIGDCCSICSFENYEKIDIKQLNEMIFVDVSYEIDYQNSSKSSEDICDNYCIDSYIMIITYKQSQQEEEMQYELRFFHSHNGYYSCWIESKIV